MKNFKRFASVVMVIMMMLSMMLPAMAVRITVSENTPDQTDQNTTTENYVAYKIFDATNSTVNTDAWSYYVASDSPWLAVFWNSEENTTATKYVPYFTLTPSADSTQYVVDWVNTDEADNGTAVKALADLLEADIPATLSDDYKKNLIAGTATDADEGYYLITSTLGSALILATTDITVTDKNTYPTLTKTVADEDKNAQIGDDVTYTITVIVPATVDEALTVHDTIEDGLTIDTTSFAVKVGATALTENTDYTVNTSCTDNCSFEITLNATDNVKGQTVVITYTAELDKDAEIHDATNDNTAWLTYSNYQTPNSTVKVSTYQATVTKVITGTSTQIEGAEFSLYTVANGGNPVALVDITAEGADAKTYKVADSTETIGTTTTIVAGKAVIQGLDSDVIYYLEETKAPDGYNMLDARKAIPLSETTTNDDGTQTTTAKNADVTVGNSAGSILPSTGGIGTTIFYCLGGAMVVGAFVLLITKKRMNREM